MSHGTRRNWIAGFILLLCVALGFGWGVIYSRSASPKAQRRILYYHDPMHPAYRSDKPGIAPDCGMDLEPVYADSGSAADSSAATGTAGNRVGADIVQAVGIVTEEARRSAFVHTIRTTGRVVQDETRVYRVVSGSEGWVRSITPKATGTVVSKGDLLAVYYGRDFQAAQQSLMYALKNLETAKAAAEGKVPAVSQNQVDAAVENLLALGVSDIQVEALRKTGQTTRNIELRAPISGFILANNVFTGMRFERGAELVRLADLTEVWITADLFRNESSFVRPGKTAKLTVPGQPTSTIAKVTDALPLFDGVSRTMKVRLQANNPGYVLRPGMFVDVEFPVETAPSLHVPVDAVVTSGTQKSVFVERETGGYDRRSVETGWQFGDRVEIVSGIAPGDRIVRSGVFLLDSEARMKTTVPQRAPPAEPSQTSRLSEVTDPVCHMKTTSTEHTVLYGGREVRLCSKACKARFEADPQKYVSGSRPL